MNERIQSMLESLSAWSNQSMLEIGLLPFLLVMIVSLLSAMLVAYLYLHFYSSRATGSQIHRAFPLLGLSVTAIFICIQFSLPLSLGLLGALSIVRFRTPIKEPEEIGFIMLVIATSLACATVNFGFLVIILAAAVLALLLRKYAPALLEGSANDGAIILSLSDADYTKSGDELLRVIEGSVPKARLESISRDRGEVVLSLLFRGAPPRGLATVESEVRKIADTSNFTVVYNRPSGL